MLKFVPPRPRIVDGKRTFFIMVSQFNPRYVQGLVDNAKKELRIVAPRATISVKRVPGAFEIPVVVRELASQGKVDAIIACGHISKGKTNDAQKLSRTLTDAVERLT